MRAAARPGCRQAARGDAGAWHRLAGYRICERLDEVRPREKSKSELITYVRDRAGHDRRYAIDAARMINELDWKPAYTFETGIEQTIHWYLDNEQWWERIRDGAYRDYYKAQYRV
jgi:dTDP-glucose 4,6-dehydratase